ncbi:MAG: prepilin peptidase [Phycisphaerales bacterium]|jgi:leader peptidase (prepilin peptidase) / N-methyltransferase|nr:prepilin peptidase [Phycisphaerales bacterium]MBT7170966.1 prepilin peptidase [Phycisphaerales bacterium]
MMPQILLLTFIATFGACVGSFLNVVIWRVPRGGSIVFPPSHCPKCGFAIRWHDNIPLLGWLILRGKCRFCKLPISARYPLIELLTSLLFVGVYLAQYPLDAEGAMLLRSNWPLYVGQILLVAALVVCSAVDIDIWQVPLEVCWLVSAVGILGATIWTSSTQWIPSVSPQAGIAAGGMVIGLVISNSLQARSLFLPSFLDADPIREGGVDSEDDRTSFAATADDGINPRLEVMREVLFLAPAVILGVLAWWLAGTLLPAGATWSGPNAILPGAWGLRAAGLSAAMVGYLAGGGLIWGIRIFGTLAFAKEAMGLGDVHILAMAGAVLGWKVPLLAFFLAPVFGLLWALTVLFRKNQRELPYGPWLSVGVLLAMLWGDVILAWWLNSMGMQK